MGNSNLWQCSRILQILCSEFQIQPLIKCLNLKHMEYLEIFELCKQLKVFAMNRFYFFVLILSYYRLDNMILVLWINIYNLAIENWKSLQVIKLYQNMCEMLQILFGNQRTVFFFTRKLVNTG